MRSLSSAHEKWGQKQKCCVYNFVQCIYIMVICTSVLSELELEFWWILNGQVFYHS